MSNETHISPLYPLFRWNVYNQGYTKENFSKIFCILLYYFLQVRDFKLKKLFIVPLPQREKL